MTAGSAHIEESSQSLVASGYSVVSGYCWLSMADTIALEKSGWYTANRQWQKLILNILKLNKYILHNIYSKTEGNVLAWWIVHRLSNPNYFQLGQFFNTVPHFCQFLSNFSLSPSIKWNV